jgi:mercuric reductase
MQGGTDRKVRKFVFDFFVKETFPPSLEEIASETKLTRSEAAAALQRLDAAHHLKMLDGTDRILMAFPFSAMATPYRVMRRNGQRYFANCAWDAIAFHPMLGEPIEVNSFCRHCGTPIRFRLDSGRGFPSGDHLPVVYLAWPAATWWNDIVRTCANSMVFFDSPSHYAEWPVSKESKSGAVLTVEQVIGLSLPLYAKKLELDFERPSKPELRATFEKLGLTGSFWEL